jgi:hypothetical protein
MTAHLAGAARIIFGTRITTGITTGITAGITTGAKTGLLWSASAGALVSREGSGRLLGRLSVSL